MKNFDSGLDHATIDICSDIREKCSSELGSLIWDQWILNRKKMEALSVGQILKFHCKFCNLKGYSTPLLLSMPSIWNRLERSDLDEVLEFVSDDLDSSIEVIIFFSKYLALQVNRHFLELALRSESVKSKVEDFFKLNPEFLYYLPDSDDKLFQYYPLDRQVVLPARKKLLAEGLIAQEPKMKELFVVDFTKISWWKKFWNKF